MSIICNKVKCLTCGDIIASISVHDFKSCSCKSVSVDGGTHYLRRVCESKDLYEELSVIDEKE